MNIKRNNIYILMSFCLLSIISSLLMFHMHIWVGTFDTIFHTKMALELRDALLHGHLLSYFSFNYFHGSCIMSMYPYYCLLPLSIIFIFTSSIIKAYSLFFVIIVLLSCIISYYSSLRFSKSKYTSYVFAIVYSLSYPFCMNFFGIGDIGITVAMAFIPLVIFGFIKILQGSVGYIELLLGLVLIAQCELPVTVVTFMMLFLWIICNIRYLSKINIIIFAKIILLYILLTSIIWVPLFNIILNNNDNTVGHKTLKAANIGDFTLSISIFSWVAIVLFLWYLVKYGLNNNRFINQMFYMSLFILIMISNLIPWNLISSYGIFKCLKQFQYMSRFIVIPEVLLSYVFAYLFTRILFKRVNSIYKLPTLILIIVILSLLAQFHIYQKAYKPEYNYIDHSNYSVMRRAHIQTHMVIENRWDKKLINRYFDNNDYYPVNSNNLDSIINNNEAFNNNYVLKFKHSGYNIFTIDNKYNIKHITLPLLYYNNEHIHFYLNNHKISYSHNKYHLININIKKGLNKIRIVNTLNVSLEIFELILFYSGLLILLLIFIKNISL